ncbi:hypothetical protein GWK47_019069 [Chionoecetes opilio]|uniref:PDZ domain-containing protein n=1 Tax=Chionoecetes opilio TaxID=41210 RepID=A0A8J4XQF9_CHIOP|nr:hypothetical protein GWK47_019069 [Chionoecetes opilio]
MKSEAAEAIRGIPAVLGEGGRAVHGVRPVCVQVTARSHFRSRQLVTEEESQRRDEILAVNGRTLSGLSHAEAIAVFRSIRAGKVIMHVGRRTASSASGNNTAVTPPALTHHSPAPGCPGREMWPTLTSDPITQPVFRLAVPSTHHRDTLLASRRGASPCPLHDTHAGCVMKTDAPHLRSDRH